MRIGVIGSGQVGQTLSQGLKKHGYETRIASRSPGKLVEFSTTSGILTGTFADVAAWGEVHADAARTEDRDGGVSTLEHEAGTVFDGTAVLVGAMVGAVLKELVEEIAVGSVKFHAVKHGSLCVLRAAAKG